MGYTINWYGDRASAEAQAKAWKRVYAAGLYLRSRMQRNVSIPTAAVGPSKPGEYPHVGLSTKKHAGGTLRRSIFLRPKREQLAVDVGTKLVYGIHWEVTNRPYIRRTFAEELGTIRAILEGKMVRTAEDVRAEVGEMKARRLGWRDMAKQRSKAAREAKQAKRTRVLANKMERRKAKEQGKRERRRRGKK